MPALLIYPAAGCAAQAAAARTRLANATVRLFKTGLNLAWDTTLADLEGAQCDFDGYPSGGIAIPSWGAPIQAPGQAYAISGGVQTFVMAGGGAGVGNVVGGFYLVTSDNVLWVAGQFEDAVPMQVPGAGQPISLTLLFPSG